jgi:F-type H+-transporting ATPase subunit gamma
LASLHQIRRQIRSIRNIAQVTRAMETVSASKKRRAQQQVLASGAYADRAWRLLTHLAAEEAADEGGSEHPLLTRRPVTRIELLVVSASRGLCGALNYAVLQAAGQFARRQSVPLRLVTVGSKARDWALRQGLTIEAEFGGVGDEHALLELGPPISDILIDDFEGQFADEVYMAYAEFVNTLVQKPTVRKLLPIERHAARRHTAGPLYTFEPDRQALLADLVPRLVELQVFLALRQAIASEHSARMVAMHTATENAQEMLDHLTALSNRTRQAAITQQVVEITEGGQFAAQRE